MPSVPEGIVCFCLVLLLNLPAHSLEGSSPIANSLNSATKYVVIHRPDSLNWGLVKDLGTDILAGIRGLKSTDGLDLIVWRSSMLTSVLRAGSYPSDLK